MSLAHCFAKPALVRCCTLYIYTHTSVSICAMPHWASYCMIVARYSLKTIMKDTIATGNNQDQSLQWALSRSKRDVVSRRWCVASVANLGCVLSHCPRESPALHLLYGHTRYPHYHHTTITGIAFVLQMRNSRDINLQCCTHVCLP